LIADALDKPAVFSYMVDDASWLVTPVFDSKGVLYVADAEKGYVHRLALDTGMIPTHVSI
jgi:sugar lactone lactonase YvrE